MYKNLTLNFPITNRKYFFYLFFNPPIWVKASTWKVREKKNLLELFAGSVTYVRLESSIGYMIRLNNNVKFLFHKFWILFWFLKNYFLFIKKHWKIEFNKIFSENLPLSRSDSMDKRSMPLRVFLVILLELTSEWMLALSTPNGISYRCTVPMNIYHRAMDDYRMVHFLILQFLLHRQFHFSMLRLLSRAVLLDTENQLWNY